MGTRIIQPPAFQRPSGKIRLGTAMPNLVNATPTLVLLDVIPAEYVADGICNTATHRITPGVAGFYSIVGQVNFSNVVAAKDYICHIYISAVVYSSYVHTSLVSMVTAICSLPNQYLTAANYVELWAQSNSGDNTVDLLGDNATFLAVQRVR